MANIGDENSNWPNSEGEERGSTAHSDKFGQVMALAQMLAASADQIPTFAEAYVFGHAHIQIKVRIASKSVVADLMTLSRRQALEGCGGVFARRAIEGQVVGRIAVRNDYRSRITASA